MLKKSIAILGSTGSIGTQALDVCDKLGFKVSALAANHNIELAELQARKYKPELISITDEKSAKSLKENIKDLNIKVICGEEGLCEAAAYDSADIILNSVVGIAGLRPTLAAIKAKKTLALANKETLVAGGELVTKAAKENSVSIIPVDSEHSAIFQCLQGSADQSRELKKILLTASGGPFFGYDLEKLRSVTPDQALCHPNWSMGKKITIDCATLMNKGLELIEAVWLFSLKPEQVEVLIHRQSIIHSAVEFIDNAVVAQLGLPDMRIPIQYALTYPERHVSPVSELDLFNTATLTFSKPDYKTFKCLDTCKKAIKMGGLYPAAANGANEQAVALFLNGKIGFTDIADLVEEAMNHQKETNGTIKLDDILNADQSARKTVKELAL